jgi:hypothetical protein
MTSPDTVGVGVAAGLSVGAGAAAVAADVVTGSAALVEGTAADVVTRSAALVDVTAADGDDAAEAGRPPGRDAVLPVLRLGVGLRDRTVAAGLACWVADEAVTEPAWGAAALPGP